MRWRSRDFGYRDAWCFASDIVRIEKEEAMSDLYAGLDVSLEKTSVCVVDAEGGLLPEKWSII